jgi:hypothetical protein
METYWMEDSEARKKNCFRSTLWISILPILSHHPSPSYRKQTSRNSVQHYISDHYFLKQWFSKCRLTKNHKPVILFLEPIPEFLVLWAVDRPRRFHFYQTLRWLIKKGQEPQLENYCLRGHSDCVFHICNQVLRSPVLQLIWNNFFIYYLRMQ